MTSVLAGWGVTGAGGERAQLLVSELVSNAVLHGGGPIRLEVREVDGGRSVRIEVYNHGSGQPRMRHAAPQDISGRGLKLVDDLSREWGTVTVNGETSVWFEVQADAAM